MQSVNDFRHFSVFFNKEKGLMSTRSERLAKLGAKKKRIRNAIVDEFNGAADDLTKAIQLETHDTTLTYDSKLGVIVSSDGTLLIMPSKDTETSTYSICVQFGNSVMWFSQDGSLQSNSETRFDAVDPVNKELIKTCAKSAEKFYLLFKEHLSVLNTLDIIDFPTESDFFHSKNRLKKNK
jgi:hypothetical protein